MKHILYLGCPPAERAETEKQLAEASLSVVWAENAASAVTELQRREMPVLLDLSRGAAALQAVRELRAHNTTTLLFAVADTRRPDLTTEAVLAGMADIFARPLGARRVASAIQRELGHDGRPGRPHEVTCDDLYSHSTTMREVVQLIGRAAAMRAGVLVRGEDGTGRQLVARSIHAAQAPPAGAFVAVDCAAFEADELDAELFGSAARQNGDANARGLERVSRAGRLYEALGGTLYLQNVAEAPTRVQARLARVLRDREAVVVDNGGAAAAFDVRPMAGVEPGFDAALADGRVREDLFRRLSVIRVDMPPLRSRQEDIPALANHFVREICASLRLPPKTLSRPALSLLNALPWRGNAVELRGLLESVVTGLAVGKGIGLEDVLAHVRLDGGAAIYAAGGTLRQARARFEREYIAAVLEQHHGRISEAAKALGIQRTNLYRKMRSLRVPGGRR